MNVKITLDPIIKSTTKSTTYCPPLDCEAGDKMILFMKDAAVVLNGTGVIVADIISRQFVPGSKQFEYNVYFDDALLAEDSGTITQCDIETPCCYDCAMRYTDATRSL